MGEPQRSDAVESDRRSSPRFPAELLGKATVRLLGGSEVTLINFSERGLLFQSETRLLVGARGTVRITMDGDTTIAAGTVVRSLVQGMASGKLAFHTALVLDQPLALATAVAERERAKHAARPADVPASAPAPEAVEAPAPTPDPAPSAGKTIEKRSPKEPKEKPAASERRASDAPANAEAPQAAAPPAPPAPEPAPAPVAPAAPVAVAPPVAGSAAAAAIDADAGFGSGFDGGSFGWEEPSHETAGAGLSVLFISTTNERTARMQAILADHRRDIVLTTVVHQKADALAEIARQHDVLLFDFAIGPDALARTLAALRSSPLGASIAIFVPQQTALPPAVSSLANACVIDTTSGSQLAVALRDAAWTPWQPIETSAGAATPREDLFWKAFDALPVPVLVVDATGTIVHANHACARLADDSALDGKTLASFFVADDGPAIARLIADGLAGGQHDTPVVTASADGKNAQVMLQALSMLPGHDGPVLALRCELRVEPTAAVEPEPARPDLAAEVAALTAAQAELTQILESAARESVVVRDELDTVRLQLHAARRERDELRGQLEIVERDLGRARELEQAGTARIAELERMVAEAARTEVALARAQSQLAASTEEIGTLRADLDALRARATSQGADTERTASRLASIESGARQAIDELKAARADAQRLARERDKAIATAEAERARAEAAIAAAREGGKKGKLGTADPAPAAMVKLQRQLEELRAELKQEQDARKELEELLDQNAANLEQTIQDYEERLEAVGAGVEDKRASKPKKTRQG
jgi:hypothetical protein